MALEFSPEQMRNPKKMTECFRKVWPDLGSAGDVQLAVLCWGLPVPIRCPRYCLAPCRGSKCLWAWASGSGPAAEPGPSRAGVSRPCIQGEARDVKARSLKGRNLTKKGKEEEEDEAGYSKAGPSWEQEEEADLTNKAVTARIPVPG